MLKKIILNGKRIPVPVPIKTMGEALSWVERHLLRPDSTITRVELNGEEVRFTPDGYLIRPEASLGDEADLRIQMDTPSEICVQTIDALRNLGIGVGRNLKPIAVHLWEYKGAKVPTETQMVLDDIQLLIELYEHVIVLVDKRVDMSNVLSLQTQIHKAYAALQFALQHSDWKGTAKVLLNQLENPILELSQELATLQRTVIEVQADKHMEMKRSRG